MFELASQKRAKKIVKNLLVAIEEIPKDTIIQDLIGVESIQENKIEFNLNRIKRYGESTDQPVVDSIDTMMEEFIRACQLELENSKLSKTKVQTLAFWKINELRFPSLAKLAKKYLSVQASSAAVERMFSIAGHIFSLKRRRMSSSLFIKLVMLKLNEKLI